MRLAFKENSDREILGLLLRVLTANSTLDWVEEGGNGDMGKGE